MQESSNIDFFIKQFGLEETGPLHVTKSVSSWIPRNHIRHVWQLERYSTLTEERYESTRFSATGSDIVWCLSFRPRQEKDSKEYIGVYIKRQSNLREDRVCLRIQLLDVDGNVGHSLQTFDMIERSLGWPHFCERADISVQKKTLSPEGTITLVCDIFELSEYTASPSHQQVWPWDKLSHGLLEELMENFKRDSDGYVTLIGKDDVRIQANQFILGARSPVLRAMFHSPMREGKSKTVELKDIDGQVLQKMVQFMNTDTVGNLDKFAEPLLVVADRYQVLKLKMLCEEHLIKSIDSGTISHLKSLAEMTDATKLKESCDIFSEPSTRKKRRHLI